MGEDNKTVARGSQESRVARGSRPGEAAARWAEAQGQGGRSELGTDRRQAAQSPWRMVPEEGLLRGGTQAGLGGRAIRGDVHQEVACTRESLGCRWGRGCPQPQKVSRG